MQVEVIRPFPNGKDPLRSGQVLDTAGWAPNRVEQMIAQRYVTPVKLPKSMRWATGDDVGSDDQPKPKRGRGRPRKNEVT